MHEIALDQEIKGGFADLVVASRNYTDFVGHTFDVSFAEDIIRVFAENTDPEALDKLWPSINRADWLAESLSIISKKSTKGILDFLYLVRATGRNSAVVLDYYFGDDGEMRRFRRWLTSEDESDREYAEEYFAILYQLIDAAIKVEGIDQVMNTVTAPGLKEYIRLFLENV